MCTRHTLLITEVPRVSKLYDLLDLSSRSNCLVFFLSLSSLLSMIITIILSNGEEKRREKNESNYVKIRAICKKQEQGFRGNDLRLPSTMHYLSSAKSGHFWWGKNFRVRHIRSSKNFVSRLLDCEFSSKYIYIYIYFKLHTFCIFHINENPIYFKWIF